MAYAPQKTVVKYLRQFLDTPDMTISEFCIKVNTEHMKHGLPPVAGTPFMFKGKRCEWRKSPFNGHVELRTMQTKRVRETMEYGKTYECPHCGMKKYKQLKNGAKRCYSRKCWHV